MPRTATTLRTSGCWPTRSRRWASPAAPLRDLFTQLFAYSLANGYDAANGGFYDSGPLGQPADRRDKVWWVQAEALVSALTMYRLTGDPQYARVYLKTWAFTDTKQTDWTTGEWHPTVTARRPRLRREGQSLEGRLPQWPGDAGGSAATARTRQLTIAD